MPTRFTLPAASPHVDDDVTERFYMEVQVDTGAYPNVQATHASHIFTVLPPLCIVNDLPCNIDITVGDRRGRVAPNSRVPVYHLAHCNTLDVDLHVHIEGFFASSEGVQPDSGVTVSFPPV